ncbi:L-serine dehydratase [Kineothrix alysoides]|uniref:L-serine ammonia-lyase n=1 Tax=Kineothrix alysoides TaxID=1469948 RepID=A0A4R1R3J3_9FIRM|nr:L-serine ammonia-lyase, iron-sulfur-dependent, subunit alpha [Kineothrix alysoides]TCL60011.1 L-serine dehydratase [Kineothrix alysoides]
MAKIFYPDFFNDVFGPIMQPGSSGSFAGTSRVGRIAGSLLRDEVRSVEFCFNKSEEGRFKQLGNMMDDRGFLGGVMGFPTDDVRLFDAHKIAREKGISYRFVLGDRDNGHKGSVTITVSGKKEETASLIGASVGGGMTRIYEINGFALSWQSDTYGVLIEAIRKEGITEQLQRFELVWKQTHVETTLLTSADGRDAYFIELSEAPSKEELDSIFKGQKVILLPAVLPVVTKRNKKPQLFSTVEEWREVAKERKISFVQAAIEYEKASSGWKDEEIWDFFEKIADILNKQIHSLETIGYENALDTPLLPVYGKQWKKYLDRGNPLSDPLTRHILTHAYAVNAKLPGVLIVPGPMGTGGGYLFSALDALREERGFSHEKLVESLVVAAALGAIAYTHTNASGEVGCVGESGVCCAMASGAAAWLAGGDGEMVEHAASMALQANMGLCCDPIPGGLEFPCITRTLRAAVTAPMYAEMALTGIDPLIPYHECLQAIELQFRRVPKKFLCGNECGCNTTPTADKCRAFLTSQMQGNLQYHRE